MISAVGPLTSLGLAAVFWGVAVAAGDGLLGFASGRLGWMNVALAVFNLVPGPPLDGGRILRSLAWRSTGDLERATRTAARAGNWVGYALIAVGILEVLLLGALIGGLWLTAIGWFLSQSAQVSYLQLHVRRMLADVPVSQMMSRDLVEIPDDISFPEAVEDFFMRLDHGAFPVRDTATGSISRIVTLATVRRTPRQEWDRRMVRDVAVPLSDACTVDRGDGMDQVLDKLSSNEARRVIVTDHGAVVGIITARDLAQWLRRREELGLTDALSERT